MVSITADNDFLSSFFLSKKLRREVKKKKKRIIGRENSRVGLTWRTADLPSFQRISRVLLPPPSQPFRNVPIRIFLPLPPNSGSPSLKVVQSPLPPSISNPGQLTSSRVSPSRASTQLQTVGSALHFLLPHLFPSRRTPVLAKPVFHGAVLPMSAPIEEVVRCSAYGDGWAYIVVRMMG